MNSQNQEKRRSRILLVDDDSSLLKLLTMRLESLGYEIYSALSAREGLGKIDLIRPDLVVSDLRMDQMDGLEFYRSARKLSPFLPFIIMTAHGTIPDAVAATQDGVFAFITKPIDKGDFIETLKGALNFSSGLTIDEPKKTDPWKKNIVTRCPHMIEIINKAKLIADSKVRILISGESGTGKELLARSIYEQSNVSSGSFISVNCSVLTEERLTHEVLPKANNGTLYLNEIDEISSQLQIYLVKLFNTNDKKNENDHSKLNLRIMASSITDLKMQMKEGKFREDLFYGLSVVSFTLPSLADRREDIALLAHHFLRDVTKSQKSDIKDFAPEALKLMTEAPWPGNIRQLYHIVEQLVALSTTPIIPPNLVEKALDKHQFELISFKEARRNFERDYLIRLLKLTEGNVSRAARSAKRNRTDFYKLLARNNIEPSLLKRNLYRNTQIGN